MRNKRRRLADVDITPLIDMMFMLIIFFVLTSSFVNGKLSVELPTGEAAPNAESAVTVSVLADGSVQWDGKNVSMQELAWLAHKSQLKDVLVAGDKSANYGRVAEVLALLKREGVSSAGLLMQNGEK
ncbi:MAG: biopolymer transporter ExbD [Synergistaceae bacterium]|nr:biopolymer transporter ExbD [Candidatus Equadaptatus faecalis]